MPGWRVERTTRAASGAVSCTFGGSMLMPARSQGAERRLERRAGRAGSRWVLRSLVIGGLAGAAWLLTGAAAHAAGPELEPVNGSFLGTATGDEPVAGGLLKAAAQPLESKPETHGQIATSILTGSTPVQTYDTAIDANPLDQDQGRRSVTAPPRASGGETGDRAEAEGNAVAPVPAELPPPGTPAAKAPVINTAVTPRPVAEPPEHPVATGTAVTAAPLVKTSGGIRAFRASTGHRPAWRAKAHSRSHAHRQAPAARPVAPEVIREDAPGGDGSAPTRMNLGAVSGIPAGGSGSSTESGSSAVLPAGIANGPVACHHCPVAPGVDARRHDAEAPTVSPD